MSNEYVTKLDNGAYRVARTRISLDSVVYAFWRGESPESIVDSFPDLTLEQTFGAIAYYLAHQSQIDAYLRKATLSLNNIDNERAKPIRCCTGNSKMRGSRRYLHETSISGGCRFRPAHAATVKLREPIVDFQSAHDAGLSGMGDPDVLALAAGEGRVLVSHDRRTMPVHFAHFIQQQSRTTYRLAASAGDRSEGGTIANLDRIRS